MSAVTIDLPPDAEAELRKHAVQFGRSLEAHLEAILASHLERTAVPPAERIDDPAKWIAEWRAWQATLPPVRNPGPVDYSRESIYEGCGE